MNNLFINSHNDSWMDHHIISVPNMFKFFTQKTEGHTISEYLSLHIRSPYCTLSMTLCSSAPHKTIMFTIDPTLRTWLKRSTPTSHHHAFVRSIFLLRIRVHVDVRVVYYIRSDTSILYHFSHPSVTSQHLLLHESTRVLLYMWPKSRLVTFPARPSHHSFITASGRLSNTPGVDRVLVSYLRSFQFSSSWVILKTKGQLILLSLSILRAHRLNPNWPYLPL